MANFTNFATLTYNGGTTNSNTVTGEIFEAISATKTAVTASEAITVIDTADLNIRKAVSPSTITENGQLTYIFVIENTGNSKAIATDNIVVTDMYGIKKGVYSKNCKHLKPKNNYGRRMLILRTNATIESERSIINGAV